MSISPQWFVKRRCFAMGVMVSGSGIGGLIMPFVMTALNESLGGAWYVFPYLFVKTLLLKHYSNFKIVFIGAIVF
jgi:hypothetical protein